MDASLRSRLEALLVTDPVNNVMALKFLSLLGQKSEGGLMENGGRWATWFHYAPDEFPFDAQTYGGRSQIVYWNANDADLARESAARLPAGGLVKVSTDPCLTVAQERWPLANDFLWFTSVRPVTPGGHPVELFSEVAEDLVALSAENGYSRQALVEQQARGCCWFVARVGGVPEALCYVQPNYGPIWEVSGVITRQRSRGRGLAKAVVAAAVNDLVRRGLTPRYFVHDQNVASLGVARSLGLEERGRTRHFRLPGAPPAERLDTGRLVLVTPEPRWAPDIYREFSPAVTRYMMPQPAAHLGETLGFLAFAQQAAESGTDVHLVVTDKETGTFQGLVGLHDMDKAEPEVGLWFRVGAQGRGYGREAMAALVGWARGLGRFRAFRYPVDRRNLPSRRIAEGLGGVVVREFVSVGQAGNDLDQVEYRIPGLDRQSKGYLLWGHGQSV